jgi:hypothetical protein
MSQDTYAVETPKKKLSTPMIIAIIVVVVLCCCCVVVIGAGVAFRDQLQEMWNNMPVYLPIFVKGILPS